MRSWNRAQLPSRLPPATEAIKREAVELSNRRDLRCQTGEHTQLRESLPVPLALRRPGSRFQGVVPAPWSGPDRRLPAARLGPPVAGRCPRRVFGPGARARPAGRARAAGLGPSVLPALPARAPGCDPRGRTAGATLSRGAARIGHNLERYPAPPPDATMPSPVARWALSE